MSNRNYNTQNKAAAAKKRVAAAKAKIAKLLDDGVPFNPQTASQSTLDHAVANRSATEAGDMSQRPSNRSVTRRNAGVSAADIKNRRTSSARAPKTGR